MKILFVADDCPYPPDNGGRLRTYNLLKHLSLRHEITLVVPVEPGINLDIAFAGHLKGIIPVPPVPRTTLRRVSSIFSRLPYAVRLRQSREMCSAVQDALVVGDYDLLHCDSISVAPAIPVSTSLPKLLNAHNVEAIIWERYLSCERRPWALLLLRSQLAKVIAYESQLPLLFDWCVTVSELDREEMCKRYAFRNVSVVPNGVDLGLCTPMPDPLTPTLAFIGSLDYRPNRDAIDWFARLIWPRIKADVPQAEMLLVGRRPSSRIVDLCRRSGILAFTDVPDIRPYLARAALVVVPLRIGSGTRLKIVEAMAAGRCVVSTSVGAEGLDISGGEHLLIADEPADFARKAVSMLNDPSRRQALAQAGRKLVEASYSWDWAARKMEDAWAQICSSRVA